jgi:hypothetical protein
MRALPHPVSALGVTYVNGSDLCNVRKRVRTASTQLIHPSRFWDNITAPSACPFDSIVPCVACRAGSDDATAREWLARGRVCAGGCPLIGAPAVDGDLADPVYEGWGRSLRPRDHRVADHGAINFNHHVPSNCEIRPSGYDLRRMRSDLSPRLHSSAVGENENSSGNSDLFERRSRVARAGQTCRAGGRKPPIVHETVLRPGTGAFAGGPEAHGNGLRGNHGRPCTGRSQRDPSRPLPRFTPVTSSVTSLDKMPRS